MAVEMAAMLAETGRVEAALGARLVDVETQGAQVTALKLDVAGRSKRLATQLLFSWKLNPQTVAYLGYSDTSFAGDDYDLTRADRTFFAKVGYAWVW